MPTSCGRGWWPMSRRARCLHGAPRISRLGSEGGTLSVDPGFAADFDRERMLIKNDISDYKFYPVVQASLGFRF